MQSKFSCFMKSGFTLVEVLISLLLGAVIAVAVVTVLVIYVFNFEQTDDITAARQRGEMVISILDGPMLHAGLGMPDKSPYFGDSFLLHGSNYFIDFSDLTVDSPVQLDNNSTDIYVFYSIPSGYVTVNSSDMTSNDFSVVMEDDFDLSNMSAYSTSSFSSWITFPTGGVPMFVEDKYSPSTLLGEIPAPDLSSGLISQYDELHYVRAMRARVLNGTFYTQDPLNALQPRVEGIESIFFDYDELNNILTVYVLSRGNKKNSDFAKEDAAGWPEEAPDISDPQYRLAVVRKTWRIRN